MRFTFSSLALLAAATAVVANDVVTILVPDAGGSGSGDGKIVGSSGSTTSYVLGCPANNTTVLGCSMTFIEGPSTFIQEYNSATWYVCDMDSSSATCYTTYTSTLGTSTLGYSTDTSTYTVDPVTVTITSNAVTTTPASTKATATASGASVTGSAGNSTASSTSASASSTTSDSGAMAQATGQATWVAGGAAMAMAVVMAMA